MKIYVLFLLFVFSILLSYKDNTESVKVSPISVTTTTTIKGKTLIKVLPSAVRWIVLKERLHAQFLITSPNREIGWFNKNFKEITNDKPPQNHC